jgi:hypothetical protein
MSLKKFLHRLNRRDIPLLPFKFPRYTKVIIFTLTLLFSAYFIKNVSAQLNIIQEKQNAFKQGNNQEAWLNNAVSTNMVTGINILAGEIPQDMLENNNYQLLENSDSAQSNTTSSTWVPGGLIGISNNLIASVLSTPPASGVQYLAQVKDDFLGKPAYAQSQGIGFRGLQPILPMWRYFRNLVYSLVSVYFVIVGIMIMLKVKISPQATITIQNSIPRIFTTLILVTFSYAIAGLLIDFMYVIQSIGLYIMFQIRGTPLTQNLIPTGNNTFEALNQANFTRHLNLLARFIFRGDYTLLIGTGAIFSGLWAGIGSGLTGLGALGSIGIGVTIIGLLAAVFFILLLLIFIFYQLITLVFGLFKCYVILIFQIIFAPILISIGIFPGSKTDFSSWLKQVMSNLLVFPATYLFLVFVNVLIFTVTKGYNSSEITAMAASQNLGGELWAPGIISWGSGFGIQLALSLTGFFLAAKIPTVLPQVLFNIKPSPWGQAMEQAYGSMMKSPFAGGLTNKALKRFEGAKEQSRDIAMKKRAYEYESMGAGLSDTQYRVAEDFENRGFASIFMKFRPKAKRMEVANTPSKTK